MRETDLQRAILQALEAKGFWAMRLNSGITPIAATESHARRVIRAAPKGTPDILLLRPFGFLEVKTKDGLLRPTQIAWHQRAGKAGIRVAVARSILEALTTAVAWDREDRLRRRARLCVAERCPLEES